MTSNKSPLAEKNLPNLKNGEKYIEHKVVKGDTLYSLSKKYETTVDAVVALNPEITDGQNIKIGHTYKFPVSSNSVLPKETETEKVYEENVESDFDEETLSSEMPDSTSQNLRVPTSTGIEKDPKIETLIAKIKTAQSFMKTK